MEQPVSQAPKRLPLGQLLVHRGAITAPQLSLALKEQERTRAHLGEILVDLGFTSQEEISACLAQQAGVEEINLDSTDIPPEVLGLLDETFCRQHNVLPISANERTIHIAMANSFDVLAVDAVSRRTSRQVKVLASNESVMLTMLDRVFGGGGADSIEMLVDMAGEALSRGTGIEGDVRDQPVVKLVDAILQDAVRRGATDVHIEPEERLVRCRLRIDGMLCQGPTLPKSLQSAVTARVKLLSDLDVSESRIPQDGKISIQIDRRHVNMRVSTLPTLHGENTVIRILDRGKLVVGLGELGFSDVNLKVLADAVSRPSGIVLVTGPTGSGKTTTLYAALAEINALERKIATLEDPIEYELPIIRQSQVNVRAGMTFGLGLRALLRQDPDVILVGEMRDRETAEVALRAAMTGHLVLSTLHTSSAAGAIPRLVDMGVEPFLVASSLVAVVAQRLLRMLCPHCKVVDDHPDVEKLPLLNLQSEEDLVLYRPVGCDACTGSGFKGRRAVSEVLSTTSKIAQMIAAGATSADIAAAGRREGMVTIEDNARELVRNGETTVDEAVRQTWRGDCDDTAVTSAEPAIQRA